MSGHTFVLTLSILYLVEMILPYLAALAGRTPATLRERKAVLQSGPSWIRVLNGFVLGATLGLIALWTLMLFTTSMYYHTIIEKVAAFMCALAVWVWMPKERVPM